MLAFLNDGAWQVWTGQRRPRFDSGEFSLPLNAEALMLPDELAAYGLHVIADAAPIPEGHVPISTTLGDDAGVPRWIITSGLMPPPPIPQTISRRQCAAEMFDRGLITGPEAIGMSSAAMPPAMVEAMLSVLEEPDQTFARIDFSAANYERSNPLLVSLMLAVPGTTEADIDDFFRAASAR